MVDQSLKYCGIVGPSNSGKTTLIEHLIPLLSPFKIAVLKHSHHHTVGPESPHKDSARYIRAGALSSMCAPASCSFEEALFQLNVQGQVDAVIVESFRTAPIPKLLYAPRGLDAEWHIPSGIVAQVGSAIIGPTVLNGDPEAIARWMRNLWLPPCQTGNPG